MDKQAWLAHSLQLTSHYPHCPQDWQCVGLLHAQTVARYRQQAVGERTVAAEVQGIVRNWALLDACDRLQENKTMIVLLEHCCHDLDLFEQPIRFTQAASKIRFSIQPFAKVLCNIL